MKKTHDYLMPDYFPAFFCKIGACCVGWPVSFSLEDYYHRTGENCSPDLRRKLDCALNVKLHPTPEVYVEIALRYDGDCPMRI